MMKIVWDFGAVLFRWRPAALLARVLPERVSDEASAAQWSTALFSTGGDWSAFDRGTVEVAELVERVGRRTGLTPQEVQAVVDAVPAELEPIQQNLRCVEALRARGHEQFYLSNMPAGYSDYLEGTHSFVRAFQGGIFSARVQMVKPEPAIYALAEERFSLEPAQTLFFDDHPLNVAAARERGWQAVLVTQPSVVEPALRERGLL